MCVDPQPAHVPRPSSPAVVSARHVGHANAISGCLGTYIVVPVSRRRRPGDTRDGNAVGDPTGTAAGAPSGQISTAVAAAALALLVVAAYWPVRAHEFVTYDDGEYVAGNEAVRRGLSAEGVRWAFTTAHASNWHPLTWLSHMLDVELFGLDPAGHHLVSVILHAVSAGLVLALLKAADGRLVPSAIAAALFALHPLRVESVAWAAERKDVLSALFGLLAIGAYGRWVRRGEPRWYAALVVLYACSLLAKPMLVTLPVLLCILDVWPLRRDVALRRHLREKGPLVLLAAASAVATLVAQSRGGAVGRLEEIAPSTRIGNAAVAAVAYVGDLLWPAGLAVFYPYPAELSPARVAGSALLLAAITFGAIRLRRTQPWIASGWAWYLVSLAPVIGIVQVGSQQRADRYTYLPLLGVVVAVAWTITAAVARHCAVAPPALAAAAIAACFWGTRAQLAHWKDSEALYRRAITVTERNYVAEHNLANVLMREGRTAEAIGHYRTSVLAQPRLVEARNNLGILLARSGQGDEAKGHYEAAIRERPDLADARFNLARLVRGEDPARARRELEECIRLRPDWVPPRVALAWMLATDARDNVRDGAAAEAMAESAAVRAPADASVLDALAASRAERGRFAEAVAAAERALSARTAAGDAAGAAAARDRLQTYRAGRPFRTI